MICIMLNTWNKIFIIKWYFFDLKLLIICATNAKHERFSSLWFVNLFEWSGLINCSIKFLQDKWRYTNLGRI